MSKGFACHKGLGFTAIHTDPDRLNTPLRRTTARAAEGAFEALSWDVALREVAQKLSAIVAQHGPNAVAGYVGNPTAFNALGSQALSSFFAQLRCRMFSSGTQDCSNKFAGSEAVFGTSTLHPVPDFEHTDYAIIFGENPKVSHMSFVSIADPVGKLRDAKNRGAVIRFVNPRRIESSSLGEVVQIKPDTDLYLMAALLHEIDAAGLFDRAVVEEHGKNLDGLRAFIAPYAAEAVAPVVGIDALTIRNMALEFARAKAACVHMSTGVNMGRQGTLCYWLLHMLSFVTGNLDREGGNLYSLGFYPAAKAGRVGPEDPFFESEFGALRHVRGMLPGNLIPDMIESAREPIRAMVVIAGNPVLSVGGGERMRRAFEKLELVVVLDMFRNATGEYADYLLPCTDMLERRDLNICGLGMQSEPFVQYTDAVVPASAERKEEWWILGKLEQAMGLRSLFDHGDEPDVFVRLDKMLRSSGLSLAQVKEAPHHTVTLPKLHSGRFYSDFIQTADKRVDCCPPLFRGALERAHTLFRDLLDESPEQLKLISLRTNFMQNSWYHNVE
ncbi:MAG TPA: molybdopterin-dependent oxidoreductase, partial [Polyangiales bacterium]